MSSKNPEFTIIIASYNGEKYLTGCLKSVFKTKNVSFEIIFIDDASTDQSSKVYCKYQYRNNFFLVKNKLNKGLVANRNEGIKKSHGSVLVFLDNDTEVSPNWLVEIKKIFNSDERIGAVQPFIYDFHKRSLIQQAGMKLVPYTGFGVTIGRGEGDSLKYSDKQEIIALGAALAVRKKVAEQVGGFDEKLFHYTDDLDFSWRVWISGYKIVLSKKSTVYHYLKVHPPVYKLYFHLTKNTLRMILKNYQPINIIKYLPTSIIFCIAGAFYKLLTGNFQAFLGVFGGFLWTIKNLSETFSARLLVQKNRRVSDNYLHEKIMLKTNLYIFIKNYNAGSKITKLMME